MKKNVIQHELSPKMEKKIKSTFIKYLTIFVVIFLLLAIVIFGYYRWDRQQKLKAYQEYVQEQRILFDQRTEQTKQDGLKNFEQDAEQMEKEALEQINEMDQRYKLEIEEAELKFYQE